jgi:hypothetical protein
MENISRYSRSRSRVEEEGVLVASNVTYNVGTTALEDRDESDSHILEDFECRNSLGGCDDVLASDYHGREGLTVQEADVCADPACLDGLALSDGRAGNEL